MSNRVRWLRTFVWLLPTIAILVACLPGRSQAADSGFNIQVSPSPLAITLIPGKQQTATVTVRNLSNHSETLVPRLNGFTIDRASEKIDLRPEVPLGLDQWISFKQSTLTIAPGATQPLDIIYNTPATVGFSYAIAITLSSADKQTPTQGAGLQASVAVFNLINIDRPDASRQLAIASFKSDKSRYEYLPATFELIVQNKGNVIDQPTGNIFIQRSFDDAEPIATIPINKASRYILPDTSRALTSSWESGFPKYVTSTKAGAQKTRLSWDLRHLNELRIGKYVAKAVLVYNDGQRDVPLVASYSFWVIPWKLLFITVVVGGLIATGLVAWGRMILKGTKKVQKYARRK